MNKRILMATTVAIALVTAATTHTEAQNVAGNSSVQVRTLPTPARKSTMTLMKALERRHSVRAFNPSRQVADGVLADLLWAACGINRPGSKKITAPSAINAQDICLYVCTADGAWLYEADKNRLKLVSTKDLRTAAAGRQKEVAEAPLFLVLVSDKSRFGKIKEGTDMMGAVDAGYVSQNICLACTALGLATVPRMTMDNEALKEALQLGDNHLLLLNHPVGYPKK